MGQIANQMFLEWCQRTAQKIVDKHKSRKEKKQKPEDAGKKIADSTAFVGRG